MDERALEHRGWLSVSMDRDAFRRHVILGHERSGDDAQTLDSGATVRVVQIIDEPGGLGSGMDLEECGIFPVVDERLPGLEAIASRHEYGDYVILFVTTHLAASLNGLSLPSELDYLTAVGALSTRREWDNARAELLYVRADLGALYLRDLTATLESRTRGVVIGSAPVIGLLEVLVPVADIGSLVEIPELHSFSEATPGTDDSVGDCGVTLGTDPSDVRGLELEAMIQSRQFYVDADGPGDPGYFAGGVDFGVSEPSAAKVVRRHVGFDNAVGDDRWTNCQHPFCVNANPMPAMTNTEGHHATATASVILGDITRGQDSAITADSSTRDRSGVARRARGFGVSSDFETFAINQLTDPGNGIEIIQKSQSWDDEDATCSGATARQQAWDDIYELGFPIFGSSGNNSNSSTSNCTASSPSSALGAFGVSQMVWSSTGVLTVPSDASRGGTSTEGRGRTIIGLGAPTPINTVYPHYYRPFNETTQEWDYYVGDFNGDGESSGSFCCSSAASPIVAGAAGLFMNWYQEEVDAVIPPGLLYANMLLMGDRSDETGARLTSSFSNLTGAGVLRLRKFDEEGMDGPWRWEDGSVCVPHNSSALIDLNMSGSSRAVVPTGVDLVKSVIWYYDPAFDGSASNTIDKVYLYLDYSSDGTTWTQYRASAVEGDNRQRVALHSSIDTIAARFWRMRLRGVSVTGNHGDGCGSGAIQVFFGYYWEDEGRQAGAVAECTATEEQ